MKKFYAIYLLTAFTFEYFIAGIIGVIATDIAALTGYAIAKIQSHTK